MALQVSIQPSCMTVHATLHRARPWSWVQAKQPARAIFYFFWCGIHKLAYRVQPTRTQVLTQYWANPKVAQLEGTPAIHVTCLYTSWYVRVVDTDSILKCSCLDLSFHERSTAWLFHVGTSQYYCVSHLSSRRSDGGLTMQVSCLKGKHSSIRIYAQWTSITCCRVLDLTKRRFFLGLTGLLSQAISGMGFHISHWDHIPRLLAWGSKRGDENLGWSTRGWSKEV